MTREDAKQLLPIIQAYIDGKTVQYRNSGGDWIDSNWFTSSGEWRVKPEPREFWIVRDAACEWKSVHLSKPTVTLVPNAEIIHVREVL